MKADLYFTLGCHLCEVAEDVISQWMKQNPDIDLQVTKVDIADDRALVDAYGIRIPVLKPSESEKTLDWPFDVSQLNQFIHSLL